MKKDYLFFAILLSALLIITPRSSYAIAWSEPANATYECQPVFQANTVPPNILIIIDNSRSMLSPAYPYIAGDPATHYDPDEAYYGYFNPNYFYQYGSNVFSAAYKKIAYNAGTQSWSVENLAGTPSTLTKAMIETGNSSTGFWDGNFMNYSSMKRIDIVRKVMMGGKATSRTGGGNQTNQADTTGLYTTGVGLEKHHGNTDPAEPLTPYTNSSYYYSLHDGGGYLYIDTNTTITHSSSSYTTKVTLDVQKDINIEPEDFTDGNLAGVLQKIGDRARWGNLWYNTGTGNNESGGRIANTIGTNMTTLITDLQNTNTDLYTPLAESYYVAVQYFAQEEVDTNATSDYSTTNIPHTTIGQDPYHNGTEFVSCAKSFVILLSDGASTKDADIPAFLKDYDGDGDNVNCNESTQTNCDYDLGGTDFLDDVALWARTTDLRSATKGKTDIEGDQNVLLYTVYAAFGAADANAISLMKDAAKNGGFDDRNDSNTPDLQAEWDKDGDNIPDNYYEADNGYQLQSQLLSAINDILTRAASGTAVSVLATSNEGEGNITQAFFKPKITSGTTDIEWLGYLQSFWVDKCGNLREDSSNDATHPDAQCQAGQPNQKLDVACDKIISHFVDAASGDTKIYRREVSSANPYAQPLGDVPADLVNGDVCTNSGTGPTPTEIALDEAEAVWKAGEKLAERPAADRKIFTFIDMDDDDIVDDAGTWTSGTAFSQFDNYDEIINFDISATGTPEVYIAPFLGVYDSGNTGNWDYLGGTAAARRDELIGYIRGNDSATTRPRTFDHDSDLTNETWKLGDIVHSTPVSVSKPAENFHTIYADESYLSYFNAYKNRETVVYIGANDGMLHAFTSWIYNSSTQAYTQPATTTQDIGDELWAYIPQSLLPHLKWLASPDYAHTYYVDMKPKVFDAKILPDETHYADTDLELNWGTFMLIGFNLGGGFIQAKEDFDYNAATALETRNFYPSYALIDITEPRNPRVMWERSYDNLQASASVPAIIRVKDKWFAIFGSGPSGCTGESGQTGYIYLVDLLTGNPEDLDIAGTDDWFYATGSSNAFINSPVSLDMNLNFSVDSIYFGENTKSGSNYGGKIHKIFIPWTCDSAISSSADYSDECDTYFGTTDKPEKYCTNPVDPTGAKIACGTYTDVPQNWKKMELYDTAEPVTAPLALSIDNYSNAWIFGGTGRYFNNDDKTYTVNQYIFGIKDPFFDSMQSSATASANYYRNYNTGVLAAFSANILNTTSYKITTSGKVYDASNNLYGSTGLFSEFEADIAHSSTYNGWSQTITGGERILNKPTILGGIVFVPSFTPSTSTCSFGGTSNLYGLYYTTGTAFTSSVFDEEADAEVIDGETVYITRRKKSLGEGLSSSMAIHMGAEANAKGLIQQSTGKILSETLDPAFDIKSRIYYWLQQ